MHDAGVEGEAKVDKGEGRGEVEEEAVEVVVALSIQIHFLQRGNKGLVMVMSPRLRDLVYSTKANSLFVIYKDTNLNLNDSGDGSDNSDACHEEACEFVEVRAIILFAERNLWNHPLFLDWCTDQILTSFTPWSVHVT